MSCNITEQSPAMRSRLDSAVLATSAVLQRLVSLISIHAYSHGHSCTEYANRLDSRWSAQVSVPDAGAAKARAQNVFTWSRELERSKDQGQGRGNKNPIMESHGDDPRAFLAREARRRWPQPGQLVSPAGRQNPTTKSLTSSMTVWPGCLNGRLSPQKRSPRIDQRLPPRYKSPLRTAESRCHQNRRARQYSQMAEGSTTFLISNPTLRTSWWLYPHGQHRPLQSPRSRSPRKPNHSRCLSAWGPGARWTASAA